MFPFSVKRRREVEANNKRVLFAETKLTYVITQMTKKSIPNFYVIRFNLFV